MSQLLERVHLLVVVGGLQGLEAGEDLGDVGDPVLLGQLAGGDHVPEEVHHTVQVAGVLHVLSEDKCSAGDVVIALRFLTWGNITLNNAENFGF